MVDHLSATFNLEELFLEITNKCFLKCLHCAPRSGNAYTNELTPDEIVKVISSAKILGLKSLFITGGEPFLRTDVIWDVLQEAGNNVLKIIFTNGTTINENMLAKLLIYAATTRLEMSIYSAEESIHHRITGSSESLQKMIRTTQVLLENKVDVRWSFVLTGLNFDQIDGVLKLASTVGVKRIGVSRIVPSGRAFDNWGDLSLNISQVAQFLDRLEQVACHYDTSVVVGKTLSYKVIEPDGDCYICNAGISRLFIQADGNTMPCPAFKDLSLYRGISIRDESLQDAWFNSGSFVKLRNRVVDKKTLCGRCKYFNNCGGHCLAQQLYFTGSLEIGTDPLCRRQTKE